MNIKIIIAYDGTKYNGWQKQGNTNNTIQGKLESVLTKMFDYPIQINGSGRTDAGVHAKAQVANFKIPENIIQTFLTKQKISQSQICNSILIYINKYLPEDIRCMEITEVEDRFHARLLAKSKHYSYTIDNGNVTNVFTRKYATKIDAPLDIQAIQTGISYFVGTHDWRSFCTKINEKKSSIRTIFKIEISKQDDLIRFDFFGDGFLYNMIGLIMRVLIDIGLHKRKPIEIPSILEAKNKSAVGFPAEAKGLCLEEVKY